MRAAHIFVSVLLPVAAVGCGDSGNKNKVDGCVGHLCGSPVSLNDNEGGNVIFEYIYLDTDLQAAFHLPAGVTTVQRTMAYFMNDMTPEKNPLPTPGQCENLDATKGWPLYVGSAHTDLDVGTLSFTGKKADGSAVTIDVPKGNPAMPDAIGRKHDVYYQVVNGVADMYLKPDSSYTAIFGGAGSIPATTMNDAIYLAPSFSVENPSLEDNGPLVGGTDYPVHWTPSTPQNLPQGGEVLGLTWLADVNGSPTHVCPTAHSAGTFTIPGATINEYKQVATARGTDTKHALLLRQAVVHQLQRLPNGDANNPRRIDMLGIMCWVQLVGIN